MKRKRIIRLLILNAASSIVMTMLLAFTSVFWIGSQEQFKEVTTHALTHFLERFLFDLVIIGFYFLIMFIVTRILIGGDPWPTIVKRVYIVELMLFILTSLVMICFFLSN